MHLLAPALALANLSCVVPQDPGTDGPPPLAAAEGRVDQPIELGQVRWGRDFDAALAESGRTERPVLLLFQEVPG